MRNNILYELAVYSGKKIGFRIRDSNHLIPGRLALLASNLCPELGEKGSIPYEDVSRLNLITLKERYFKYMKQDILLLGGVMQKAQDIYWKLFSIDIESKITLPSLALTIYRTLYYDESHFQIHIPSQNEGRFLRQGCYGGHTDTYKPHGTNLYYYDVNSLYPFIMKELNQ